MVSDLFKHMFTKCLVQIGSRSEAILFTSHTQSKWAVGSKKCIVHEKISSELLPYPVCVANISDESVEEEAAQQIRFDIQPQGRAWDIAESQIFDELHELFTSAGSLWAALSVSISRIEQHEKGLFDFYILTQEQEGVERAIQLMTDSLITLGVYRSLSIKRKDTY